MSCRRRYFASEAESLLQKSGFSGFVSLFVGEFKRRKVAGEFFKKRSVVTTQTQGSALAAGFLRD